MALIRLIHPSLPEEVIEEFVVEVMKLLTKNNVEYALATFRDEDAKAICKFKKSDFNEFDDCYRMVCQLDRDYVPSGAVAGI